MKSIVRWTDWGGEGLEHCALRLDDDGLTLEGVVVTTQEGLHGAHYRVRTDATFRTREVRIVFVDGPGLHLNADGEGHWRDAAGNFLPALDGCIDVDIRITPATNTLPIKRLRLGEGGSRDLRVAYVPLPEGGGLRPRAVGQRYTCLRADSLFRYQGLESGFTADIEVDADGLVMEYPGAFRRV